MRKRKPQKDPVTQIRSLFARWKDGEDVSEQLDDFFAEHPELLHRPPVGVGKRIYIEWTEFTGHNFVWRDKHGIIGECECGFYPPKN